MIRIIFLMNNNNYNKYLLNPFTFAFLLIFTKWLISYYFFFGSFETKIIYETSDNLYFPLIKSFSTFSFNTSYSNEINDLKLISYPILGLLVNTVFFKVFGIYSFFILEILGVYLFLFIFIKIFNLMNFSYILSFFFALTLFVLPQLLIDLSIFNFQILSLFLT